MQNNSNPVTATIYCISPESFNTLEGKNDLGTAVLPNLINQVLVYEIEDVLIDIGSPAGYQLATIAYAKPLPGWISEAKK